MDSALPAAPAQSLTLRERRLLAKKARKKEQRRRAFEALSSVSEYSSSEVLFAANDEAADPEAGDMAPEEAAMDSGEAQQEEFRRLEECWRMRNEELDSLYRWQEESKRAAEAASAASAASALSESAKDELQRRLETRLKSATGEYLPPPSTALEELRKNPMYGIRGDGVNCLYYLKTGICKFDDRCSRFHDKPTTSRGIVIRNMYETLSMNESLQEHQEALEFSEQEVREHFREFYDDVLPELSRFGKVSNNALSHLRGSVYVEYASESEASAAQTALSGRFYGGRQCRVDLLPPTALRWHHSICGQFLRGQCPKGSMCNFIHPFEWLPRAPDRRRDPHQRFLLDPWGNPVPDPRPSRRQRSPSSSSSSPSRHHSDRHRKDRRHKRSRWAPARHSGPRSKSKHRSHASRPRSRSRSKYRSSSPSDTPRERRSSRRR